MLITYDRYEANNNLQILYSDTNYQGVRTNMEVTSNISDKLPKGHLAIPYENEIPNAVHKLITPSDLQSTDTCKIYKLRKIPNVKKLLKDILKTLDDYVLEETDTTYEIVHSSGQIKLYKD